MVRQVNLTMPKPHGLTPEGVEIKSSDRNYISDSHGSWRVLNYQQNGVDNSDVYQEHPVIAELNQQAALKKAFDSVMKAAEEKAKEPQVEAVADTDISTVDDA
jgi:hypothetical protein